jgi:twinkle protein
VNEGQVLRTRHQCEHCSGHDSATTYLGVSNEGEDFAYSICYSDKHDGDDIGFRYVPSKNFLEKINLGEYTDLSKEQRVQAKKKLFLRGPIDKSITFHENYRGITTKTQERYGVFFSKLSGISFIDEEGNDLATNYTDEIGWFFPYYTGDTSDELVAYKVRLIGNKVDDTQRGKKFTWVKLRSDATQVANLFGSHLDPRGKITSIVEGEVDALSADQMHGGIYPVLSVKNGAQTARKLTSSDLKRLEKYEQVVIDFDTDPVAQKEVKRIATLFPKSARLVQKSLKDANEYLELGKENDYVAAWWAAKPYAPDGIVFGSQTKKFIEDEEEDDILGSYPSEGLNSKLEGIFPGQVILITAGSGVGKSSIAKAIAKHNFEEHDVRQGLCFFEETVKETTEDFISIQLGINLRKRENKKNTPKEKRLEGWSHLFEAQSPVDERWAFWDHFGSNEVDKVINNIRYLAVNFGAKIIYVDHITIIVSDHEANADERRSLDTVMTKLATIAVELGVAIVAISHLKRPNGQSHEEGGVTSLSQLRGSHSLAQLAHVVIGAERNGQSESEFEQSLVILRVLKNRKLGATGPAAYLEWNNETSRFTELTLEEVEKRKVEFKETKREIAKEVKKAREEEAAMDENLEGDF